MEEIKKRLGKEKGNSEWEMEREEFFKTRITERGEMEEIAWKKEKEMPEYEVVEGKEITMQREERRERIENSNYNKWYKRIKGEGIPKYHKKG